MYLILVFFVIFAAGSAEEECYKWNDQIYKHLGTKTPYRMVANKNDSKIAYEGCEAKKIWMIIRHGTRYPSKEQMNVVFSNLVNLADEIVTGFKVGSNIFCKEVSKSLETWTPDMDFSIEKHLAHEGEEEMLELAERFQKRLPELFPKIYSSFYKFRTTDKQRTKESNRHFMIGLFGRKTVESILPISDSLDQKIIRFYRLCPRWKRDVKKNPLSLLEKLKFEGTEEWAIMTKNISARLGLDYVINQDTLRGIYTTCAFETSWSSKRKSPWCALLSHEEFKAIEYTEDLKYYHIDGYGHPLNYLQACPAIQDLIQHFTEDSEVTTSVSFTHSGTLLKLLSHFGLYNDSDWRKDQNIERQWRVSQIDAFGTNLAAVLFNCGQEKKFLFLHQERPVFLEGCPKEGLCPLSVLLKSHGGSLNNCRFDQMCTIPDDSEL